MKRVGDGENRVAHMFARSDFPFGGSNMRYIYTFFPAISFIIGSQESPFNSVQSSRR